MKLVLNPVSEEHGIALMATPEDFVPKADESRAKTTRPISVLPADEAGPLCNQRVPQQTKASLPICPWH